MKKIQHIETSQYNEFISEYIGCNTMNSLQNILVAIQ